VVDEVDDELHRVPSGFVKLPIKLTVSVEYSRTSRDSSVAAVSVDVLVVDQPFDVKDAGACASSVPCIPLSKCAVFPIAATAL
jgi:hypothetical protein